MGVPEVASCAAVKRTTLSAETTETHRLPALSKARARGPGIAFPKDALSMVTSGILAPELASMAAG